VNKKALSEQDICTKFITPALKQAGWDEFSQIREEVSEQHRIVARVDELMALCDHLEAQLTSTQTQTRRLLATLVAELV
jgi:type I site-specific restriction endonuclease